ncbi:cytoskeleton protein RodZ [Photobacterium sp. WH77]|uniref:Cytoskeleton protein RodZ n=1 Tax=Photobacterium arenosum TaxID=2774143 RepID=A0ABR9BP60_9GAMM|nr:MULTISPECIES: cytoskeleton protein RodZ [Photobacterium]MBD8514349.1 cytoskeleton protein RodZ [Photobacterium arenosum]MCG2835635.1 cytoskeleton protein RodZ [Photobacterium sp. WH77]MCG2843248.1 cytoskeleton protein RodZ [Photobacterium sp. WH80]MDO6580881.1 cytoskeleton protein RodZ [Photobacterium sp. 2_MG-2023]
MNTEQNEERVTEDVIRPGDMLRQAREQLGYSQKDVASRLRLRMSVIDDIENNRFDEAQMATFTRGYVRSYAKFVGLDVNEVLNKLESIGQGQPQAQTMQSFSRKTKRDKHDNRVMGLTWLLGAVIVGMTAAWWWQTEQKTETPVISEQVSPANPPLDESLAGTVDDMAGTLNTDDVSAIAEGATQESPADDPYSNTAGGDDLPLNTFDEAANNSTSEMPAGSVIDDEGNVLFDEANDSLISVTAPVAEEAPAPDLQLTFNGDCWIDIRDANGKQLDTGIKSSGDVVSIEGQAPFKIVLGAPSVVTMSFKGEPVDLSGYPAGRVARLKLPL